jgi:hypothetical protein
MEQVLALPRPEPEDPGMDRRQVSTGRLIDRGAVPDRYAEIPLQVVPLEGKDGVAPRDRDGPQVGSPAWTLRQRPVNHQPGIAQFPVLLPNGPLQGSPFLVNDLGRLDQVSQGVRRILVR